MAPTVAICRSSLGTQSRETMGFSKRSLSSGIWFCQPSAMPAAVQSGNTYATRKESSFHAEAAAWDAALDVSLAKEEEQEAFAMCVCETPKAKKHRIPVVNVDLCPPAPKKPRRARRRLPGACSSERERSNFLQKLSLSRGFLI